MAKPLTDQILEYLVHTERVTSLQLSKELEVDHQKVVGAVKSLQSVGEVIKAEQKNEIKVELTTEGKDVVAKGSHEVIVFNAVPVGGDGILQPELMKATGANGKIGMSKAIQNGWIKTVKDGGKNKVIRMADSVDDKVQETLKDIAKGKSMTDASVINEFKKRKLIVQQATTFYEICRGDGFTTNIEKQETDLTPEMLASGDWKTKNFKTYNFEAKGVPPAAGHLHPLMKVRSEFRSILFEMGFSEMPTNKFVESSFWNFDALYVPQKHPARDAQDTFFVSQPVNCKSIPEDYMLKVRDAHIGGKYGSQGYGSEWKKDEAMKNVMRTHTTAISARMLYEMGQQKEFKPAKLFSIDRVFRNETLDATHLAEFHQVEGVVADRGINLCHLMGIMKEFFGRLGIHRLRFKPAYNPYTEPSMEVFAFHSGLNKWVEVGNSGMFRPEMLLPMGIPEDVNVIAWGLSLERPTMIRYGYDNIRDLVGPRVDLQMVYKSPICRLDKDSSNTSDKTGVTSWEDSVKSSVTHFFASNSCSGDCSSNSIDLDKSQPDIVKPVQRKKESKMPNDNPLTSHVLDTSKGRPAVGILVKLYKLDSERNWNFLEQQETNKDGRVGNLLTAEQFTAGTYKLYFETRSYFANEKTFYPYVEVVFTIEDPTEHYHVPILLSAFGYSTYRGS